jgi:hypothetical protein
MSDSVSKYFENQCFKACTCKKNHTEDAVVQRVINKYKKRSKIGIEKYNTTLEASKEDDLAFLNHLQEELFDASLYIEVLLSRLKK